MIRLSQFDKFYQAFSSISVQPLRITAELYNGSHVINYSPIYFDNLLAGALVRQIGLDSFNWDRNIAYDIPIPLRCAWRSLNDYPLYESSCFFPEDEWTQDTIYYHKRAITGEFSRNRNRNPLKIVTIMGEHMERRVPMPALSCNRLIATCVGNAEWIDRLLSTVTVLGKRRANGYNDVKEWHIEATDDTNVFVRDGRLSRAVPVDAVHCVGASMTDAPTIVGWTVPQWKPVMFSDGWAVGTQVAEPVDKPCA